MKRFGTILFFCSYGVCAETLTLKEFDQIKLGELINKLPDTVALKTIIPLPGELPGSETHITFPVSAQGFQFFCRRSFYNASPFPSFTACSVTIDPTHASYDKGYDEIRFSITDPILVQAFHSAIPYGQPSKEFYSWERDAGTNYEGKTRDIFHYRFECTLENCLIRFSGISTNQ